MDAGGTNADLDATDTEAEPDRSDKSDLTTVRGQSRRVAQCECGAQLAGASQEELFDAVQRHLAHHHPQLLGALGLELVKQMAEDVGD